MTPLEGEILGLGDECLFYPYFQSTRALIINAIVSLKATPFSLFFLLAQLLYVPSRSLYIDGEMEKNRVATRRKGETIINQLRCLVLSAST